MTPLQKRQNWDLNEKKWIINQSKSMEESYPKMKIFIEFEALC